MVDHRCKVWQRRDLFRVNWPLVQGFALLSSWSHYQIIIIIIRTVTIPPTPKNTFLSQGPQGWRQEKWLSGNFQRHVDADQNHQCCDDDAFTKLRSKMVMMIIMTSFDNNEIDDNDDDLSAKQRPHSPNSGSTTSSALLLVCSLHSVSGQDRHHCHYHIVTIVIIIHTSPVHALSVRSGSSSPP